MPYRVAEREDGDAAFRRLVRLSSVRRMRQLVGWTCGLPVLLGTAIVVPWYLGHPGLAASIALTALFAGATSVGYWWWGVSATWAGLMPTPPESWRIDYRDGAVEIVAGDLAATVPLEAVRHAVHVADDGWEQIAGLDDSLVLTTDDGSVRIPRAADGFGVLLTALSGTDRLQTRVVT